MYRNLFVIVCMIGVCCLPVITGCSGEVESSSSVYDDENATDEERIIFAVKSGNIDVLQEYMDQEPNLATMYDSHGSTLLHYAALFSQVKVADYLLDNGADINAQSATGDTPLAAAEDGNASADMIIYLEDNGADS